MSLTSLLCSVKAPDDVAQLRRIYVAPDISTSGDGSRCRTHAPSCGSSAAADGDFIADLLVTCNRSTLLHYQWNYTQQHLSRVIPTTTTSSSSSSFAVPNATSSSLCCSSLPTFVSSVRDMAWCPFKKGKAHAHVLSACRSQPLQLWNLYPSSTEEESEKEIERNPRPARVIAVKRRSGSEDIPEDSTAVTWWRGDGDGNGGVAAAGYSAAESPTSISFFDMQRVLEGSGSTTDAICGTYVSPLHTRSGPVSVLHSPSQDTLLMARDGHFSPPTTSFFSSSVVLAGYYRRTHVEAIDVRHGCPAVVLHASDPRRGGDATQRTNGGVGSICTHPCKEYLVFATGRGGSDRIHCWDLRQPMTPLVDFLRPSVEGDLQRCELAVLPAPFSSPSSATSCHTALQASDDSLHACPCDLPVAAGEAEPVTLSTPPPSTTTTSSSSLFSCAPLEPPYMLCCTYSCAGNAVCGQRRDAPHRGGLSFFTTSPSFSPRGTVLPCKDFSSFTSGPTSGLALLPPTPSSLLSHPSAASAVVMAVLSSRVVLYGRSPRFLSSFPPMTRTTAAAMHSHGSDFSCACSTGGEKHTRPRWEIRHAKEKEEDENESEESSESDGKERLGAFYRMRYKRTHASVGNAMEVALPLRRDRKDTEDRSSSSDEEETGDTPLQSDTLHAAIHVISLGG